VQRSKSVRVLACRFRCPTYCPSSFNTNDPAHSVAAAAFFSIRRYDRNARFAREVSEPRGKLCKNKHVSRLRAAIVRRRLAPSMGFSRWPIGSSVCSSRRRRRPARQSYEIKTDARCLSSAVSKFRRVIVKLVAAAVTYGTYGNNSRNPCAVRRFSFGISIGSLPRL